MPAGAAFDTGSGRPVPRSADRIENLRDRLRDPAPATSPSDAQAARTERYAS
ncbi:hypothetical protein [Streptomyces sp. NPDC006333]|uniref:hypothetical protein n=1 Tax=Streptomyces sp. NPDC006333 TaxID=3156753 RepID=UPI0033A77B5C